MAVEFSVRLQAAVRQYLAEYTSRDVGKMAKHIYRHHCHFQSVNYPAFKHTVETALDYIQFVDSIENEKTPNKRNKPSQQKSNELVRSKSRGRKKSERLARRREVKMEKFNTADDCFIIDVKGSSPRAQSEDISIIYSQNECTTPVAEAPPVSKATPVVASSAKKRLLQDETSDRVRKRALLSTMLTERVPDVELSELGGLNSIMESVYSVLMLLQLSQPRPISLLLSGPPGAGKTALACAMAKAASLPVMQLRLCDIATSSSTLTPEKKIAEELINSVTNGPALVLISQLDEMFRDGGGHSLRNLEKGVTRLFTTIIHNLTNEVSKDRLLIVAECSHVELLDPKLQDCFSKHICIKPPTADSRRSILEAVCSKEHLDAGVDLRYWGLKCSGFLAGDFVRLLRDAKGIAIDRCLQNHVTEAMTTGCLPQPSVNLPQFAIADRDFVDAFKVMKPTLKKDGFPSVPETTWQDVGGLQDVREELRKKMLDPIREPDLLDKYNKSSSGVLLWGPPGCGKTLVAKALANEAGVNLLTVKGPELLSMYQGESERAVRVVFAKAASVAPCIIFFDEFDSLCPKRSGNPTGSGSKSTIVNTLLTEMSGFMDRSGVYLMATTNFPSVLDPAVLRPGRFDTLLYVGLPDLDSREAVFRAATKNGTLPMLASDVNLRDIAEQCKHFSGADCHNLVESASTEAFEELRAWRMSRASQQAQSSDLQRESQTPTSVTSESSSILGNVSLITTTVEEKCDRSVLLADARECPKAELVTYSDEVCDEGESLSRAVMEVNMRVKQEICSNRNTEESSRTTLQEHTPSEVVPTETSTQECEVTNPFDEGEFVIYARHFRAALSHVSPSISEKVRRKYDIQRKLKEFI